MHVQMMNMYTSVHTSDTAYNENRLNRGFQLFSQDQIHSVVDYRAKERQKIQDKLVV